MKYYKIFSLVSIAMSVIVFSVNGQKEYLDGMKEYRQKYIQSVTNGNNTPLMPEDAGYMHFFKPDPKYVLECKVMPESQAKAFEMPTYSGLTRTYIKYATCECKLGKSTFKPVLYKNLSQPQNPVYRNHLFLPFKDATSGAESYGGGRYINLDVNDIENGKIIIDFNKAYNPYCAYSDGYNCPVPPKENHFKLAIKAGEKNYTGPIKKRKID